MTVPLPCRASVVPVPLPCRAWLSPYCAKPNQLSCRALLWLCRARPTTVPYPTIFVSCAHSDRAVPCPTYIVLKPCPTYTVLKPCPCRDFSYRAGKARLTPLGEGRDGNNIGGIGWLLSSKMRLFRGSGWSVGFLMVLSHIIVHFTK